MLYPNNNPYWHTGSYFLKKSKRFGTCVQNPQLVDYIYNLILKSDFSESGMQDAITGTGHASIMNEKLQYVGWDDIDMNYHTLELARAWYEEHPDTPGPWKISSSGTPELQGSIFQRYEALP